EAGQTAPAPLIKQLGEVSTVVMAFAVILSSDDSAGDPTTSLAVLVSVPVALVATLTTMVMLVLVPALTEPSVNTKLVVPVAGGVAETSVTFDGSESVTVTDVAWSGLKFVTAMLYVSTPPGQTGSGLSVLVMARSVCTRMLPGFTEKLSKAVSPQNWS